jgi:xylose isomerase
MSRPDNAIIGRCLGERAGIIAAGAERSHDRRTMTDLFTPRREDRFTFGLWTVGNPGRDPFGAEVRAPLDPVDSVHRLADLGAYGVSFHDNDLVPYGSSATERDDILKRFRRALDTTGMHVPMVTTNLFWRPVFKEGAFTANDPRVRRLSVKKACEAVELGGELGADVFVLWGGREGMEAEAAKDVRLALDRYKEAIDLVCEHIVTRDLRVRIALEPKPNEPRGDILLPTVGHALAFIGTLERPEMVGLNPEFAHETMSGLSFSQAVAQVLWQDKLFHIDLNAQRIGKFDQDFRFGSEGVRDAFYVVKLLEDSGWDGMRHFDAHPYRTEDADGVWDFARGCMRTYLILADKARRFHEDTEIQEALRVAKVAELAEPTSPAGGLDELLAGTYDEEALAGQGYGHERLDQLVTELLLGAR